MRVLEGIVFIRCVSSAGLLAIGVALGMHGTGQVVHTQGPAPTGSPSAALTGAELVRATYTKYEYLVPMRDGARLFTAVFVPKDAVGARGAVQGQVPAELREAGADGPGTA